MKKTYKDIAFNSSIVTAFIETDFPYPSYSPIVEEVLTVAKKNSIPAKIFIKNKTTLENRVWFEKIWGESIFENTDKDSILDIESELQESYRNVFVIDKRSKKFLFESNTFISVDIEREPKPEKFNDYRKMFENLLEDNDIRKLYQTVNPPKKYNNFKTEISEVRENYFQGKIFQEGTIVEDSSGIYEIISRESNYVSVVDESGNISRKFISDIKESNKEFSQDGYFKCYQPSDTFLENTQIKEAFDNTIELYNKGIISDAFAILKSIKLVDDLVQNKNIQFENLIYSLNKINQLEEHSYLMEYNDEFMNLHQNHQLLKGKSTDDVLKDHQNLRKIGVDYEARDVGGKREMIKDILSHNHGANKLKSYKALKANIRQAMDKEITEVTKYGSDRAGEFDYANRGTPQNNNKRQTYSVVNKQTGKTVSVHNSTLDAVRARGRIKNGVDTHTIKTNTINEVHLDPDYKEEKEILGYDQLKKNLAKITGIDNYGEQEPGETITLIDKDGNPVKTLFKIGSSSHSDSNQTRLMRARKLSDES